MEGRLYNHSIGNGEYTNIEPYSKFTKTGSGNVTITNIGHDSMIDTSGSGDVTIQGTIGENLIVINDGPGEVTIIGVPPKSMKRKGRYKEKIVVKHLAIYQNKIPESMRLKDLLTTSPSTISIDELLNSLMKEQAKIESDHEGLVKVTMNGITTTYAGSKAKIKNNEVYVDKIKVKENDLRIIHKEPAIVSPVINKNNIVQPKIESDDGLIKITRHDRIATYGGRTATITDNVVYIDGVKVEKNDSRLIFEEPVNEAPKIVSPVINNINNVVQPKIQSDTNQVKIKNYTFDPRILHKEPEIVSPIINKNNPVQPKIEFDDGLIKITWKDSIATYGGRTATITDNVVYIDGVKVEKNDSRLIFEEPLSEAPKIASPVISNVNNIVQPKIESDAEQAKVKNNNSDDKNDKESDLIPHNELKNISPDINSNSIMSTVPPKIEYNRAGVIITNNGMRSTFLGHKVQIKDNEVFVEGQKATKDHILFLYEEPVGVAPKIVSPIIAKNNLDDTSTHKKPENAISSNAMIQSFLQSKPVLNASTTVKKPIAQSQTNLDEYSETTNDYINMMKGKTKFQDQLKDIILTSEQERLLMNYFDPITFEVMNIPVRLHETLYDLETVLQAYEKDRLSPLNRYAFVLRDIQSARIEANLLQGIITQIKSAHEKTQITEQSSSPQPKNF